MEYQMIFQHYLEKKNLRLTRVREIILETVFATHSHFDVGELCDLVQNKGVSRATVYRTLPLLVESGLVKKTLVVDNKDKYEHIYGHPHHFHIVCKKCGKVVEQIDESLEKKIVEITQRMGFDYIDYNLKIQAICPLC